MTVSALSFTLAGSFALLAGLWAFAPCCFGMAVYCLDFDSDE